MPNQPPIIDISLFRLMRQEFGDALPPMRCTKATLVHLSHTLEDMVLREQLPAVLFTGFQESSHWRAETERYRALAAIAQQVCIFAGGSLPPESSAKELHVTLRGSDPLRQEWFLVLLCDKFSVLLCGQDHAVPTAEEATRQFDTLWSFEPAVLARALDLLERVVANYRPDRLAALREARAAFPPIEPQPRILSSFVAELIRYEEQLQQQLHATSLALQEQLRWRDDLTATLVHDMRSPLQGIALAIQVLSDSNQFDQQTLAHMLTVARRSSKSLSDLVQLILDTNQIASGQLTMAWQPIHPSALLAEALEPFLVASDPGQPTLATQIDGQVKIVWGDRMLLVRVLQNLVSNALKFTSAQGKIHVAIALAPAGRWVEIRVRDTGAGISQAALPTIFERYYQANEGDRRGVGLGLYFCRLASEVHGGSIRATSQLGRGTTITVVLPASPPTP
jgi:signal transduction histidine kinase